MGIEGRLSLPPPTLSGTTASSDEPTSEGVPLTFPVEHGPELAATASLKAEARLAFL